jgi:hypothetical protein
MLGGSRIKPLPERFGVLTLLLSQVPIYAQWPHSPGETVLPAVFELFPVLAERSNQLAGTLSGGEQQMGPIGRGLASAPDLLMLDERRGMPVGHARRSNRANVRPLSGRKTL